MFRSDFGVHLLFFLFNLRVIINIGSTTNYNPLNWEVVRHPGKSYAQDISYQFLSANDNAPSSPVKIIKGFNLEIQKVQLEDAGTYLCFLPFPGGEYENFLITSHELKILGN